MPLSPSDDQNDPRSSSPSSNSNNLLIHTPNPGTHTLLSSDQQPSTILNQNPSNPPSNINEIEKTPPDQDPDDMIAVQRPSVDFSTRGSYVDMDDDEPSAPEGDRSLTSSVFTNFRRFIPGHSQSASQSTSQSYPATSPLLAKSPEIQPRHSTSSTNSNISRHDDDETDNDATPKRPSLPNRISVDRQPFPSFPFTFPLASSPPSSPSPTTYHFSRPSLEGVFDSPSPPPRATTPKPPAVPSSPTIEEDRSRMSISTDSSATGSTATATARKPMRLPRGENPLIFGGVTPRRVAKSGIMRSSTSPKVDTAGSTLRAPTLSVTGPTPQGSPSKATATAAAAAVVAESATIHPMSNLKPPFPTKSNSPPKTVTIQDESPKTKGKRKSEELDKELEDEILGHPTRDSTRVSNTSSASGPPTALSSSARRNSKRVKMSPESKPPSDTYGHSPDTTAIEHTPDSKFASSSSRPPSSKSVPRSPTSPAAPPRPKSGTFSTSSRTASTLPVRAIVSPRPPSIGVYSYYSSYRGEEGLHMRDPGRAPQRVGWGIEKGKQRLEGEKKRPTSMPVILFYAGFLLPFLWWIGGFFTRYRSPLPSSSSAEKGKQSADAEKGKWDKREADEARIQETAFKTWRNRCRFMALVSLITYLPLVVLLAVFIPR